MIYSLRTPYITYGGFVIRSRCTKYFAAVFAQSKKQIGSSLDFSSLVRMWCCKKIAIVASHTFWAVNQKAIRLVVIVVTCNWHESPSGETDVAIRTTVGQIGMEIIPKMLPFEFRWRMLFHKCNQFGLVGLHHRGVAFVCVGYKNDACTIYVHSV